MNIPSYKAAIIAGAVSMPLLVSILDSIDERYAHVWYLGFSNFIIAIFVFFLPFIISTVDLVALKKKYHAYIPKYSQINNMGFFNEFCIPAYKRMGVMFLSGALSLFSLYLLKSLF